MMTMYRFVSFLVLAASYHLCLAELESTNSTLSVSTDGSCGGSSNQTCLNSTFGSCCSLKGFCGSTNDFCSPSAGCQSSFGSCSTNTSFISYDGKCGSTDPNSQVCVGSTYGSCCSQNGWCGSTTNYCGVGCQSAFGTCGGENATVETNSTDAAPSGTTSRSVVSTSTATGSSSTSGGSSADSTNATNSTASDAGKSGTSTTGFEIAIGVLGVLIAILSIVLVMLLLKRRARQYPEHNTETMSHSVVEAPPIHQQSIKDGLFSTFESSKQHAVELGSTGHGRAELREDYVEIDNQKR